MLGIARGAVFRRLRSARSGWPEFGFEMEAVKVSSWLAAPQLRGLPGFF